MDYEKRIFDVVKSKSPIDVEEIEKMAERKKIPFSSECLMRCLLKNITNYTDILHRIIKINEDLKNYYNYKIKFAIRDDNMFKLYYNDFNNADIIREYLVENNILPRNSEIIDGLPVHPDYQILYRHTGEF